MNRTIKFRVWDIYYQKMTDSFFMFDIRNGEYIYYDSYRDFEDGRYLSCKVMQFTGLYDCEGKEVWEGDVLEIWIENIKQDNRYTVEDLRELYFEMNRDDSYYRINQIKVLGNLYEHPNSLNEEIKD